jgi:hypothetical protein
MSAGHYCDCETDRYLRRLLMACTARFSRGSARGCLDLSGTRASWRGCFAGGCPRARGFYIRGGRGLAAAVAFRKATRAGAITRVFVGGRVSV